MGTGSGIESPIVFQNTNRTRNRVDQARIHLACFEAGMNGLVGAVAVFTI
jgi:hypothetical protein